MDSAENRDDKLGRPNGQEWEDPAFAWDDMKAGIFEKITAEDPDFFREKRKRRLAIWWWFGAAVLLIGGIVTWQFSSSQEAVPPNAPAVAPVEQQARETAPVADSEKAQNPAGANESSGVADSGERPPSGQATPVLPKAKNNRTSAQNLPQPAPEFAENKTEKVVAAAVPDPVQTNSGESSTAPAVPSLLPVALRLLATGQTVPTLAVPAFAAAKNTDENDGDNTPPSQGQWQVAATGGTAFLFGKYAGASDAVGLRNDHTTPWFGYQLGLEVAAPVSAHGQVFFGLNRQVLSQLIDVRTQRQFDVLQQNALVHVTHYVVGDRAVETYGDTTVTATERNRLVNYNEFRSVQAQLGYARNFGHENWNLRPFAGLAVGLFDHQEGLTVADDRSIFAFDNENPILQRFQLKTVVGVAVERKISNQLSLTVRYRFDQQWNNASREPGLRVRPSVHGISIGVARSW